MSVEKDIATIKADVSAIKEDVTEIKGWMEIRNGRLRSVELEQAAQKTRAGIIGTLAAAIGILAAAIAAWLGGK